MYKKMMLFDKVYLETLNDLNLSTTRVINTLNPHSYCVAKKDPLFQEALNSSDVLMPDGIGIVWALQLLKRKKINKIAGFDLFIHLMTHLNKTHGSCFFLGASKKTLAKIIHKTSKDFPNVTVHTFSPPYKSVFSEQESEEMRQKINSKKPDVLFVGMTAPKQEKWVHQNKTALKSKTICSIGAVFDFYAGNVKRPARLWIYLGLEWLVRLLKEPGRLYKRNFISSPKFVMEVLSLKIFDKEIL